MNSGFLSLLSTTVLSILFMTGWGTRYVQESRVNVKSWVTILFTIGLLRFTTINSYGIRVHLPLALISILLVAYFVRLPSLRERFMFLFSVTTAISVCFIFMLIVPHDPAFYLLDQNYLYPLCTLLIAYLFSRKPLFSANVSMAGVLFAGIIYENRISFQVSGSLTFGSIELLDLVFSAFVFSFIAEQLIHGAESVLLRFQRNPESNLEGDPS